MVADPGAPLGAPRVRALNLPRPVDVRAGRDGTPRAVRLRGRWLAVEAVAEAWRLVDGWWREREVRRWYFRLVLADGRTVTVFRDLVDGRWYAQHDR